MDNPNDSSRFNGRIHNTGGKKEGGDAASRVRRPAGGVRRPQPARPRKGPRRRLQAVAQAAQGRRALRGSHALHLPVQT